jgi:hypothetical protein
MQTKCAKNVIEHKTQDEDKQNTKHRMKTNKAQNTGLRQTKHKTQD